MLKNIIQKKTVELDLQHNIIWVKNRIHVQALRKQICRSTSFNIAFDIGINIPQSASKINSQVHLYCLDLRRNILQDLKQNPDCVQGGEHRHAVHDRAAADRFAVFVMDPG